MNEPTWFNVMKINIGDEGMISINETSKIDRLLTAQDQKGFLKIFVLIQYKGI